MNSVRPVSQESPTCAWCGEKTLQSN